MSFFTPNENREEDGVAVAAFADAEDALADDFAALGPNRLLVSNLVFSASLGMLLTSK